MADDIAINRAQRTTLFSLQQIERDSGVAQRRLSFGRRIVDVTDGATQFFQARSLSNRITDFTTRGEQVDQAISALQTFVGGAQTLQSLLDIARGHVLRAEAGLEDTAEARQRRASITADFVEVLENFYETANSLQYNGLNLLINEDRQFSVRFSDRPSDRLQVDGRNLFDTGAYTLRQGNLFGRNVVDTNTGTVNFANTQLDLDFPGTTADTIVVRGTLTSGDLAADVAGVVVTPGVVTFSDAVVSAGTGTEVALNAAATGTATISPLTYRGVDSVTFTTDAASTVIDNGDGSFTITDIASSTNPLELGALASSGVVGRDTAAEVNGFSAIQVDQSAILDDIRTALDLAKDRLETIESYLGSNVAILQERLQFGIAYGNNLTIGRDKIVLADVNAEAAILTTLRTRNQIGIGALASNAESEQQLLRLLS